MNTKGMNTKILKRIKINKELGKGNENATRTSFGCPLDGTNSELLLITALITMLWILITHTV
jgi:hypothetical protein